MTPARLRSTWCRALDLSQVSSILESSAQAYGVVRLGSITRLDGIGIPTVSAVRAHPMGESVSINTGKGASELQARVGALAEALERYCAEPRGRVPMHTARISQLQGAHIRPSSFTLPADCLPSALDSAVIDWCQGRTLNGTPVWIPANAVFFPFIPSPGAQRLFAANTTGLAVGSTINEALVFALLECIERDAYSRAVLLASIGRGAEVPVVDLDSVRQVAGAELAAIQHRGHDILVRDLRCDTQVPCYLCTIYDGQLAHYGTAARCNAAEAVKAALQEAAQSRLTDLQGAREDLADRSLATEVHPWFLLAGDAQVVPAAEENEMRTADQVLLELRQRLDSLNLPEPAAWVELSLPEVGLAVLRAVVPGLEVWAFDSSRLGSRARQWQTARA